MVSCGYEPTAVIDGFGSLKGFWAMVRGTFSLYKDEHALKLLNEPAPHGPARWCRSPSQLSSLEASRTHSVAVLVERSGAPPSPRFCFCG